MPPMPEESDIDTRLAEARARLDEIMPTYEAAVDRLPSLRGAARAPESFEALWAAVDFLIQQAALSGMHGRVTKLLVWKLARRVAALSGEHDGPGFDLGEPWY